jgi:hypothetical protein
VERNERLLAFVESGGPLGDAGGAFYVLPPFEAARGSGFKGGAGEIIERAAQAFTLGFPRLGHGDGGRRDR